MRPFAGVVAIAGVAIAGCGEGTQAGRGAEHAGASVDGRGAARVDTAAVTAGVDSLNARFVRAFNADDSSAFGGFYTDDAVYISAGPVERGRERINRGYFGSMPYTSGTALRRLDLRIGDGLAVETGVYTQQVTPRGGAERADSGLYVAVVERQPDGAWRWRSMAVGDFARPRR
jgi:uncharacterized protein (TIGR02246 family)